MKKQQRKKKKQKWFPGKINKSDKPINKLMQWGWGEGTEGERKHKSTISVIKKGNITLALINIERIREYQKQLCGQYIQWLRLNE